MQLSGGSAVPEVDPIEADELVAHGASLLDVREPEEFDAGHAPGSTLVPLGLLDLRRRDVPDGTIVCVCRSGSRSAVAASLLRAHGRDARNLTGGLLAWVAEGLPLAREGGASGTVL